MILISLLLIVKNAVVYEEHHSRRNFINDARSWPHEDQEELAEVAREIEARRTGIYVLNDEEEAAVEKALEQIRRGEFVSGEEMDAFWLDKLGVEALELSDQDVRQGRFATKREVKAVFDRYRRHQGEAHVVKTLELAMSKAANLPEAAQEELALELLERIDELAQLRAEIEIGLKELDAGLGKELDVEELLREFHADYDREKK